MLATRLVARPDDTQLAYSHAGRLGLLDAAMHELAATDLALEPRWLGFVGDQLALLDGDELVAYNLPGLAEATRCAIPTGATIRAVVGERAAIAGNGLDVIVARFLGKRIDVSSFTMIVPAQHILGLEDNQLMVVSPARTDVVDAVSKRVTAHLQLPLPPAPREAGTTHQLRYVWTFRPGRPELIVVRLSDGRPFQQVLDAPIRAVHASVSGPWLVAETEAGPRRVHVQTLATHAVDADLRRAACVTGGAEPSLYWLDGALRVQRTALAGQAVAPTGGGRAGGVRMEVEPMGTVGGSTPTPTPTAATVPSTSTPTPATPSPVAGRWRLLLAEWARSVMSGKDAPTPTLDKCVADVVRRSGLNVDGARALALLYGAWVGGEPRLSLAVAARTIEWDEIAGGGTLARAGLTEVIDGRVRLRSVVARFLDGGIAERLLIHGVQPRPDVAPGRQLVHVSADMPFMASAHGLAERMGAAAIVDELRARGASELRVALDEAWLRGLPVIAIPGLELDAATLAAAPLRADHALVILWPDPVAPVVLDDLPKLDA